MFPPRREKNILLLGHNKLVILKLQYHYFVAMRKQMCDYFIVWLFQDVRAGDHGIITLSA